MSKSLFFLIISSMAILLPFKGQAQNPIIQTKFTADPAPMVYQDTVFLYTSHDEDDAKGFEMQNWLLYTSTDMVNWTDHGIVASLKDFGWARQDKGAWAPQAIERDGKFYLYCPLHGNGIGVLVADSPYGPFKDPLGKRLIDSDHIWNDIDPTVYIDDDGQAYLYWGNPDIYYVKLNKDMISYSGKIHKINSKPQNYQEGPWFYKRKGHYYLAYASTCCPEGIGYAMSSSPTEPWEYKGMIMDPSPKSSGNHPGIIDYKGNSYVFGFNYAINYSLTDTHRERRSVCMAKIMYNADGTIKKHSWWSKKGVSQLGTLNPYQRTEAETIAWESGVETEKDNETGVYVTDINDGDYIKVRGADFGKGADTFEVRAASLSGGTIQVHLDNQEGPVISTCEIENAGGGHEWKSFTSKVKKVEGIHDIYFVFIGGEDNLFNLNTWKFNK